MHLSHRTIYLFLALLLTAASNVFSQEARPGDENWDAEFGLAGAGGGVSDEVFAIARGPGGLVVGGTFLSAVGAKVNHVALWTGLGWEPLGDSATGFGVDGPVFALLMKGDSVIVGGQFTKAGNVPATNLAIWNMSTRTWSAFGSIDGGQTPYVSSLARSGDSIYVGGQFTHAGGVEANNVALWNGDAWQSLGNGANNGVGGTVNAIAIMNGVPYVGGNFSSAGTVTVRGIATFNGYIWKALGDGIDGYVNALAVNSQGLLAVGGNFTITTLLGIPPDPNAPSGKNIAVWNGTGWIWAGMTNDVIRALAFIGRHLYVGGTFATVTPADQSFAETNVNYVAKFDGLVLDNQWYSQMKGGTNGYVNALVADEESEQVYAGGAFTKAGGTPANHIARWDGRNWYPIGTSIDNIVYGITVIDNTVYIAWSTPLPYGGESIGQIARWDNGQWKRIGQPIAGLLYTMTHDDKDILVGGSFATAGSTVAVNVARMNTVDTVWKAFNKGSGVAGGDISYVQAIAKHGSKIYLGGSFTIADTIGANNIAVFDRSTGRWDSLGNGLSGPVRAITVTDDGDVYAGGDFLFSGSDTVTRVAHWDGTKWNPMTTGANASVLAMASIGDDIYIGGDFDTVDGQAMNHVARWNRKTHEWFALNEGITGHFVPNIAAMATVGRYLYVAGYFEKAGPDSAENIARWDGYNWQPLGSGVNSNILAMTSNSWQVYVGGSFTYAGPNISFYVGLWHEPVTGVEASDVATTGLKPTGWPNPFSDQTRIHFHNPQAGPVRVQVFDVHGRSVATVADRMMEEGDQAITWDGSSVPTGNYLCVVRCGDRVETVKVTLAR